MKIYATAFNTHGALEKLLESNSRPSPMMHLQKFHWYRSCRLNIQAFKSGLDPSYVKAFRVTPSLRSELRKGLPSYAPSPF